MEFLVWEEIPRCVVYDLVYRYGQIFEEIFLNNHWELDGTTQVSAMYYDWNQSEEEISRGLESFFIYDVKVILYAGGRDIAKLICVAESMGFFDSNFVWYVWSWVWPHALESIPEYCREDQIENLRKSDGFFVLEPNPKSLPETKIDVGITTEELFQEIQIRINDDYENNTILAPSNYDLYVYDAVWIVANSVHALMNKSGQQLFDAFFEVTETVSFSGLSGKIEFGEGPHTLWPQFALKQLKGFETEITLAEGSIDALDFIENISWVGGEQPLDYTYNIKYTMVYKMLYIDWYTAVALDTVGAIFVLISLFCIFVNNFYRKKKMIKITSPMINNFILLGVILVLSGVFFGSYLAFGENKDVFLIICYAKTLFFATGFTLGFGGLFCKTWRVYRALTNKSVNKRVAISDISLLCKLSVLLLLDLIYFVLKLFVDPFFVDEDTVSIEFEPKGNGKTKMHWKTYSCESQKSYPEYILAVVKTLLVIFGVFLSFETRSVHIDELNDSRTIAVSIYNAVVCFVFGAFTTYASGEFQPTMNFVLQSAVVLYCVAFLVGTHFLPRQIKVLRYPSVANDVNIRKTSPNSHVTTTMTMNKKLDYE